MRLYILEGALQLNRTKPYSARHFRAQHQCKEPLPANASASCSQSKQRASRASPTRQGCRSQCLRCQRTGDRSRSSEWACSDFGFTERRRSVIERQKWIRSHGAGLQVRPPGLRAPSSPSRAQIRSRFLQLVRLRSTSQELEARLCRVCTQSSAANRLR